MHWSLKQSQIQYQQQKMRDKDVHKHCTMQTICLGGADFWMGPLRTNHPWVFWLHKMLKCAQFSICLYSKVHLRLCGCKSVSMQH